MTFELDDEGWLVLTVEPHEFTICTNCPNAHIVMGKNQTTNFGLVHGLLQLITGEAEQLERIDEHGDDVGSGS